MSVWSAMRSEGSARGDGGRTEIEAEPLEVSEAEGGLRRLLHPADTCEASDERGARRSVNISR